MKPRTEKLVRATVIVALGLLAGLLYFGTRRIAPSRYSGAGDRGGPTTCEGCPLAAGCDRTVPCNKTGRPLRGLPALTRTACPPGRLGARRASCRAGGCIKGDPR